jgi:carbon storage regulator
MLVLTRKRNEAIQIGGNIVVAVHAIKGNRVVLAISAPKDVPVLRAELLTPPGVDHQEPEAA